MENRFARQRIIRDIKFDDGRVQVIGYIKKIVNNEYIILDDKSGELKVQIEKLNDFKYKIGDLINILGDLDLKSDGEKILNAEIVQDMNKLNFKYYVKLYELKKELE
ncbi:MAG: hypothetical protein ACTSQJ_09035 [Promethearchaeota archaeon]